MSAQVIDDPASGDCAALPRLALLAGAGSAALGATVLFGWAVGSQPLKQLVADVSNMRPVTAVCLILLGSAIATLLTRRPWLRHLGLAAAATAGLLASLSLLERASGWNLLVDQVLFPESVDAGPDRGRMAPAAAVEILLLVSAVLAVALRRRTVAQALAVLALAGSTVAVLGYLYGARDLYANDARSGMALNTALGLVVVSLGLLAAIPNGLLPRLLGGPDLGQVASRRLLLLVTIVLPAIGWARLAGERNGWYGTGFGASIMVVAGSALVIAGAWRAVLEVHRSAASLRHAWHELGVVSASLEGRLRQRDVELAGSQGRFRGPHEAALDALVTVDGTGKIVLMNRRAQEIFGYEGADLEGRSVEILLPERSRRRTSTVPVDPRWRLLDPGDEHRSRPAGPQQGRGGDRG